ncbi:MAG: CoA-binding protein [Marinilabiliales bacterium]|nr:MAG: CoA-binding protein [Marinilabiliales bacterium]
MTEKKTLVLGASPNPIRFSYKAVKSLQRYNVPVVPVGIKKGEIGGIDIITDRPHMDDIHTVTMYVGPARQKDYYSYLLSLQPSRIIFNPGTENSEFMEMARKEGIEVLEDCTLIMLNADRY